MHGTHNTDSKRKLLIEKTGSNICSTWKDFGKVFLLGSLNRSLLVFKTKALNPRKSYQIFCSNVRTESLKSLHKTVAAAPVLTWPIVVLLTHFLVDKFVLILFFLCMCGENYCRNCIFRAMRHIIQILWTRTISWSGTL